MDDDLKAECYRHCDADGYPCTVAQLMKLQQPIDLAAEAERFLASLNKIAEKV
jgi:hypothetical protein